MIQLRFAALTLLIGVLASRAASAWIGDNLNTGKTLMLEFTPIIGGVFGSMTGVGLGYEGSLSWKRTGISTSARSWASATRLST